MKPKMVANRVRELRTSQGMTQAELAEKVGVARQSIISIEKGQYFPSIETALRISQALKTPLETVFWLKEQER